MKQTTKSGEMKITFFDSNPRDCQGWPNLQTAHQEA